MDDSAKKNFQFALNVLNKIGYTESSLSSRLCGIVLLSVNFILLLGQVVGFMNRDKISAKIETFYSFNISFFFISIYYCIVSQEKQLKQFLSFISQKESNDDNLKSKVFDLTTKRVEAFLPIYTIIWVCNILGASSLWCFFPFLSEFDYRNKNFYTVPYFFQCTDNGVNQFPILFLCIEKVTPLYFFWSNLFATVWVAHGTMMTLMFISLFSIFMYTYVDSNITVIEQALLKQENSKNVTLFTTDFHQDTDNQDTTQTDEIGNDCITQTELINIIKYHQYVYRIIKIIGLLIERICSVYLISFVGTMPLLFFTMRTQETLPGTWLFQIKAIAMTVAALFTYWISTLSGQIISEMVCIAGFHGYPTVKSTQSIFQNTDIMNAVYSTPWYNQNTKFRKTLIQFQILLQTPIEMKSFGIYVLNFAIFGNTLRVIYNTLNLMVARIGLE